MVRSDAERVPCWLRETIAARLRKPRSGECVVRCDEGAECVLDACESPVECPDGVVVCNGACPG